MFYFILKNISIIYNVIEEKFNYFFDIENIIKWESYITLNKYKIEIFTFDISFIKIIYNVFLIELYDFKLFEMWYYKFIKSNDDWERCVNIDYINWNIWNKYWYIIDFYLWLYVLK